MAELCVSLPDCPGGADVSFEIKSTVPFSQPWTEEDSQGGKARDWADELRKADLQAGVTGKTNRRTGWSPTGWYFRSFVFQSNVYHTRQERGRGYITRVTQSLAPATFAALAVHALKFETSKSSCPREEDPAATTMRGTITKGQICPTWYGSTTPPTRIAPHRSLWLILNALQANSNLVISNKRGRGRGGRGGGDVGTPKSLNAADLRMGDLVRPSEKPSDANKSKKQKKATDIDLNVHTGGNQGFNVDTAPAM